MASCLLTYFDPELCFSGFVQETPDLGGVDVKSLRAGSSQCYNSDPRANSGDLSDISIIEDCSGSEQTIGALLVCVTNVTNFTATQIRRGQTCRNRAGC